MPYLEHVLDPITVEPSKAIKQGSKIEQYSNKGKQLIQEILIYDQKYNKNLENQSGFGKSTKKIHEKSKMNSKRLILKKQSHTLKSKRKPKSCLGAMFVRLISILKKN